MARDNTCWSCQGTGKWKCKSCDDGFWYCSACGGSGQYDSYSERGPGHSCRACHGSGGGLCRACNGSIYVTCRKCGGTGKYPPPQVKSPQTTPEERVREEKARAVERKEEKHLEDLKREWRNYINNLGENNCIKAFCPKCKKESLCAITGIGVEGLFIFMKCTACQGEFSEDTNIVKPLLRRLYRNPQVPRGRKYPDTGDGQP